MKIERVQGDDFHYYKINMELLSQYYLTEDELDIIERTAYIVMKKLTKKKENE